MISVGNGKGLLGRGSNIFKSNFRENLVFVYSINIRWERKLEGK